MPACDAPGAGARCPSGNLGRLHRARRHDVAINAEHTGAGQNATTETPLPSGLQDWLAAMARQRPGSRRPYPGSLGRLLAGYQAHQDWKPRMLTGWMRSCRAAPTLGSLGRLLIPNARQYANTMHSYINIFPGINVNAFHDSAGFHDSRNSISSRERFWTTPRPSAFRMASAKSRFFCCNSRIFSSTVSRQINR